MRRRIAVVFGVLFVLGLFAFVYFSRLGMSRVELFVGNVGKDISSPSSEKSVSELNGVAKDQSSCMLIFGGDMMFDRYIRTQSDRVGKEGILATVRAKLLAADMVVANLEGPITSNTSKSVGSAAGEARNYVFTFDPAWAKVLADNNIRLVNIGNNHILNFGASGLIETRQLLRDAGVKFFGDPMEESFRTYVASLCGRSIGFVNFNQFYQDAEHRALADIERLRSTVDVLFIYTHWGTEYTPATTEEKRLAHLFIDRGADAVIGSHPHVVQEHETYRGKTIYYSLGNFVFDQYFNPETTRGLLIEVSLASDDTPSFQDIPIRLSADGKTSVAQ